MISCIMYSKKVDGQATVNGTLARGWSIYQPLLVNENSIFKQLLMKCNITKRYSPPLFKRL